jgi:hypothetical protein
VPINQQSWAISAPGPSTGSKHMSISLEAIPGWTTSTDPGWTVSMTQGRAEVQQLLTSKVP